MSDPLGDIDRAAAYLESENQELSIKERAFIALYFANSMSATRAYREMYPDVEPRYARVRGYTIKCRPHVKKEIERITSEQIMGADEVIAQISALADASMADLMDIQTSEWDGHQTATINLNKAIETGAIHYIKKLTKTKDGDITIQMPDKLQVLMALARIHGLFNEPEDSTPGAQANVHVYVPDNGRDRDTS